MIHLNRIRNLGINRSNKLCKNYSQISIMASSLIIMRTSSVYWSVKHIYIYAHIPGEPTAQGQFNKSNEKWTYC